MLTISDGVDMEEVKLFCDGKLTSQKEKYPAIRGLSEKNLTEIMTDNRLVRVLFPHNVIATGFDILIPSAENCSENVFFQEHKLYAVPKEDTTALATCEFVQNPNVLLMFIGLHGALNPEVAVAFVLWFIPYAIKYKETHSSLHIMLQCQTKLDIKMTKTLLQDLPFYTPRPHKMGIMMEYVIFHVNL